MLDDTKWIPNEESESLRKWAENLHISAQQMFAKDGTHASIIFFFNKEKGLISIQPVPPNVEYAQVNEAIANSVYEHDLYGVVLIGEAWTYKIKEKDHTAFQILDGEMRVSDLNAEDKQEALIVRMESVEGDCLIYTNEIIRDESGIRLKECTVSSDFERKWFHSVPLKGESTS